MKMDIRRIVPASLHFPPKSGQKPQFLLLTHLKLSADIWRTLGEL